MIYVCSLTIILAIIIVAEIVRKYSKKYKSKISFREALDLTGLPVITLFQNNKKFNFLLDTGSEGSVLNSIHLNNVENTPIKDKQMLIYGVGGTVEAFYVSATFTKNQDYDIEFMVADISEALNTVKSETGVTIHGIIGNNFFEKYKYVIDYKSMIAYSKC
jgi:hypothetical protein